MSELAGLFGEYRTCPIALYGLSTETEKTLAELDGKFHIVGLLDGFRETGALYGKQIIPLSECTVQQIKLIIVVARPGSCRAIAKRIGSFCMEHGIALIDVRGRNLIEQNQVKYDFGNADGIKKSEFVRQCKEAEVLSADLFDTLIMRRVLFPADVIELVDNRLKETGIFIDDFCAKRLQAEKELSQNSAPALAEIYESVLSRSGPVPMTASELADFEWQTDAALIVPRRELAEVLSESFRDGKEVYIVTDTYYSKQQITRLLELCGIVQYTDIYVSCEYKISKTQGLFDILRRDIHGRTCLHIGDDLLADIESAQKAGLGACRISSGLDLLEEVGFLGLWDHTDHLSSRIKIGMFAAKLFNSPFQFEAKERAICIDSAFDLGYLLLAPMITDFVIWFRERIEAEHLKNIWFSARDGYLIKKLYDLLAGETGSVYFLTSRMAAVRAGMEHEEDIRYIAGMKFSGTMKAQLKERFGIETGDGEAERKDLLEYGAEIMERAREYKRNYQRYIAALNMSDGDIAFFDFVAKGTGQMYCSRFLENHLKGFYFLQLEKAFMKDKGLDIQAFYEDGEAENSSIFDNYYILEAVLTSPMPSVLGFDENGAVCYANETRDQEEIACSRNVQDGIMDYFKTFLQVCPACCLEADRGIDEVFLEFIHHLQISDRSFLGLTVEDPFFNRMTDMADLI